MCQLCGDWDGDQTRACHWQNKGEQLLAIAIAIASKGKEKYLKKTNSEETNSEDKFWKQKKSEQKFWRKYQTQASHWPNQGEEGTNLHVNKNEFVSNMFLSTIYLQLVVLVMF